MSFDPIAYLSEPRWRESRLGLGRMRALLDRVGAPERGLSFTHVAGTNGKGSVCACLGSILQAAGYRTGLFTSPFIDGMDESIRVDGENISFAELRDAAQLVREAADAMDDHPTEFELLCAVAMLHFARRACDIVVLEVGLGGRFDATNVIEDPEVCVIARIGLDHTDVLGDTLGAVAREKAGIVKDGSRVVSWPQEPQARAAVEEACGERRARVSFADFAQLAVEPLVLRAEGADAAAMGEGPMADAPMRRFAYRGLPCETRLLASYQPRNAALAIDAALALRERGWDIPAAAIQAGIAAARWPGRFEVVARRSLTILDGGHNPQGAQVLAETLGEVLPGARPAFVVGVLSDKDYASMLEAIAPLGCAFVAYAPSSPRALPGRELAEAIRAAVGKTSAGDGPGGRAGGPSWIPVCEADGAVEAWRLARSIVGPQGAVCAFGSLYSMGEMRRAVARDAMSDSSERRVRTCTD